MHIGSRRWLRLCAPAAKLLHGAALRRVGDPTGLYLAPSPRYAQGSPQVPYQHHGVAGILLNRPLN